MNKIKTEKELMEILGKDFKVKFHSYYKYMFSFYVKKGDYEVYAKEGGDSGYIYRLAISNNEERFLFPLDDHHDWDSVEVRFKKELIFEYEYEYDEN